MCKAGRHAPRLMATAVVMDLRHHFSKRWHVADVKKHRRRWQGNPNGRSNLHKYFIYLTILRVFTSTRPRLVLRGWWQQQLIRTCTFVDGPAMTRIDRNSVITKIYPYEIKQDFSKNIFLLLGCHYYDSIAHWFFFLLSLATAFVLIYKQ